MATKKVTKTKAKPTPKHLKTTKKPPKRLDQSTKIGELPTDVREWIERASATMNYLRGKIDRLETENSELKAYKKWAVKKIMVVETE
jgi:hypothetical protein